MNTIEKLKSLSTKELSKAEMKETFGGNMKVTCDTCIVNGTQACTCCVRSNGSGYIVPLTCRYIGNIA
ncbi:hypothetical protein [Tenacibaculum amylolyticum]|uniref:hypothetical protein n=1 Tax=Tenacibaculum amylolyticum TaxID=104269 RepID=UPI0038961577